MKNLLNKLLNWVLKKGPSETKKEQASLKKEQAREQANPQKEQASLKKEQAREQADPKREQVKRTKLGVDTCVEVSEEQGASEKQGVSEEQGVSEKQGVSEEQGVSEKQGVSEEQGASEEQGVSETGNANHALITQLSRTNHPINLRCSRYAAVLLMVFVVGVGQAWGAEYEADPFVSITATSDTIQLVTTKNTLLFRTVTSRESLSSGAALYGGAYQTSSQNKTYAINVGSNPTSKKLELNPYWFVLYSPNAFQAGDSIVIGSGNGTSSGYWVKFMAASSSTYNTNLNGGTSLATPSGTTWSKNVDYYYILPADFETSNYIAFQATGGTCYYKYIKFYHAAAAGCTAPNHVDISGAWDKFGGETISLTATAYSSAGTESPIADANITGWQWQKWYDDKWNDISDGTDGGATISGATTKNLQISNCSKNNSGSYQCVVSTGATCSTASSSEQVKVFVLECYTGGTTIYNFTRDGENQRGSVEIELSASTAYQFKFHVDNDYFGNNASITGDITNYVFCNSNNGGDCASNFTVNSGSAGGKFVFTMDYSTGGNSSVLGEPELSVTYPRKRIYMQPSSNWQEADAVFFIKSWGMADQVAKMAELSSCDAGVYYADIYASNTNCLFTRQNPDYASNIIYKNTTGNWAQSDDITISTNNSFSNTDWGVAFTGGSFSPTTYTISFAGNGNTSGSMTDVEDIECEEDVTLAANAYVKTGYTFTGWKDGSSNDCADEATISNITADIELTAQWSAKQCTVSFNTNGGSGTITSVTATYDAAMPTKAGNLPTKTGYTFAGFFDGEGGTGNQYYKADGTSYTNWDKNTTSTTTLYAKWICTAPTFDTDLSTSTVNVNQHASASELTVLASAGGGTVTYQWYKNTANSTTSPTPSPISGATSASYTPSTETAGTMYYFCEAKNTTGGNCTTNSSITPVTVTATYRVVYNGNGKDGGSDVASSSWVTSGTDVTTVANTWTKSDYKFKWWNTEGDGTGEDFYVGEKVTIASADVTLYAQWEEVDSDEEFWVGDPKVWHATTHDVTVGDMNIKPQDYTSNDNMIDADFTGSYKEYTIVNATEKRAVVMALGAKDKYIEISFTDGSTINELDLGVAAKDGPNPKMAVLYSTTSDFSSGDYYFAEVEVPTIAQTSKQVTSADPDKSDKYKYVRIYMQLNTSVYSQTGGTGNKLRIYSVKAKKGASCSAPTSPSISGTTAYTAGDNISLTASATGTASGVTTYTWYKGADWATASEAEPVQASSTSGATFTKASCVVGDAGTYWCNISNGTGCDVQVSKTITVTAAYTLTNAVSPAGYGTVDEASVSSIPSGTSTSSSSNTYTVNGTTVTATPTAASAEYTYAFDSWSGLPATVTANATVTAVFTRTANDYSLAWSTNGGSDLAGTPTSGTVAYGTTLTKPTDPTRSGYDFDGWFTNNDGTGTEVGSTMPAANTTYYAKWTQTVTLDANTDNGGDEDGSATATINGTALSSVSHATGATGYKLTGYFTAATGGTKVLNANGTFAATSVTDYITDGKWTKSGATTLYAQWEEGCIERSLSKVVLTSTSAGTVTGYNFGEYAGDAVIGGLSGTKGADVDDTKGDNETGYKLSSSSAIVFATLKKGTFQEGDQVKVTITYQNDNFTYPELSEKTGMDIYYGTNASDATLLTTLSGVDAAGTYSYTLTSSDISAIGSKVGIGVCRTSSRGQNQYVYSVEIVGCREYKTEYTVTYDGNGKDSGDEPVDTKTYEYKDQVTVLGNTGNLSKTGYTFRGWTDGTTFYRAGDKLTMKADDVTLKAVWESNSGTETVTLTYFENANYSTSSSKPDGLSRYFYGYKSSTKTAANALTITTDGDGNVHGQNSDVEMRLNYTKKVRIYADNSTTERAATGFTGVTAISFKWMFIASGNSGKTELTSSYTVKVGATTVADAVSITGKTTDGYATVNITGIDDLDGYVEIYFGGSSSSYNVYLDDIAITYDPYVDVTYDNMTGFGGTASMPGDIVGVPVGSKINRPADPTTEDDYVFSGWYKEAACSNAWDFASDKVTSNTTLYAKWIASNYSITWMVGDDEEPYAETKALAGVSITSIPTPPADNTIGECANSFRGWSETNLYGAATSTQPADLFIDAAGAPIISADKTFYAVFGTATTAAYAGTVLWSENWTGASNNDKPTGPTESGSVVYRNPTIEYRWECGKDSEGTDGTQSRVSTGASGATGGTTPDALIGSKTGAGGTGGYLLVDGIPVGGAKTVTVQYVKNSQTIDVSYYLDGDYSGHNEVKTSTTTGNFDIDCSGKSILKLKFEATTTSNVRLDNIVVKIKEDGATNYRCICPELTLVGPSADLVFVTSTAEKTVRSQEAFTVSGKGLTKSTDLTTGTFGNSKFAFKTATGGTVSTNGNGELSETEVYVFYTPAADDDEDGLDEATEIKISIEGAGAATSNDLHGTKRVIGRHLPAEFVIAAKRNNKWYALPSNMASTTNPQPAEIAVNDISNPSIAYTATSNIYSLVGPTASNISGGKGDYIRFVMMPLWVDDADHSKGHAPLFGRATGENTIGKSGNSQATSDLESGGWWWKLVQTNTSITNPQDAKYTIYNHNNTSSLSLRENAGNPDWGLFASGVEELRLIPASDIVFTEAYFVEWAQHGGVVEVDAEGVSATSVVAHLGEATSAAIDLVQTKAGDAKNKTSKYNYTVNFGDGIDFADAASNGAMLTLEWKNEATTKAVSNIVVPKIVASNITINKTNYPLKSDWNTEVHVLPGKTVTVDADYSPNPDVTIKELNIYPGATVVASTGTLIATNLVLRNGWSRAGEKTYDVARLYVTPSTATMKATNVYADWYIDYDQYYPVAVPWNATVANFTYRYCTVAPTVGPTANIRLRYYDGASRAENIQEGVGDGANWKEYGAAGNTAVPATLTPSSGYIMTAKRPSGKAFSIIRMPLTLPSGTWGEGSWTTSGESGAVSETHKDQIAVTAHGVAEGSQTVYAEGWNLIANPYMAVYTGTLSLTPAEGAATTVNYVNIPDVDFKEYSQLATATAKLKPASAFLIQAPKTGTITFGTANRKPSAPSYRKEEAPESVPEQQAYIVLNNEQTEDMMGILVSDQYTAKYEINADLEKLLGDGTSLRTYMRYGDRNMAYLAINKVLAQEWIPVNVRLPQTGEYTFSLHEASRVSELEGLYLIDYTNNEVTNLIEDSYTFVAEAGTINNRFEINATVGERQTPTEIDVVGANKNGDEPIKFLYHDKVFIWHRGVIYDATGKKVGEINK